MKRVIHLSAVEAVVRDQVCGACDRRTPGTDERPLAPRACEVGCTLFSNLPAFWRLAVRTDPMVGAFEPALRRAFLDAAGATGEEAAEASWQARGTALAKALGRLSGQ